MEKKARIVVTLSNEELREAVSEYIEKDDDELKNKRRLVGGVFLTEPEYPLEVIGMEVVYE